MSEISEIAEYFKQITRGIYEKWKKAAEVHSVILPESRFAGDEEGVKRMIHYILTAISGTIEQGLSRDQRRAHHHGRKASICISRRENGVFVRWEGEPESPWYDFHLLVVDEASLSEEIEGEPAELLANILVEGVFNGSFTPFRFRRSSESSEDSVIFFWIEPDHEAVLSYVREMKNK